eukprot:1663818-Rhodomonas_salina.2
MESSSSRDGLIEIEIESDVRRGRGGGVCVCVCGRADVWDGGSGGQGGTLTTLAFSEHISVQFRDTQ